MKALRAPVMLGDEPAMPATADPLLGEAAPSLEPADWTAFRGLAHRMLEEALDLVEGVRERPVWKPVPAGVKAALAGPMPLEPMGPEAVCEEISRNILPYATGNIHPRFFGWVHGSGTAGGIVAEMLAAAMNANVGGRDHGAVYVERQVIEWFRWAFGLPEGAGGLLVSGTSMATLIALTAARNRVTGTDVRRQGVQAVPRRLVAYASAEAHGSVAKALEILGLGTSGLRSVPTDGELRLDVAALSEAIAADRRAGHLPFAVVATAGTVNTGATDPLAAIADLCAAEELWLHVDGAFGSLAILSEALRPRLAGIERADSIAFDFHKWLHVPYDAGCVLVRDSALLRQTFATRPAYLARHERGLAAGDPWFCELGPELSRGFRALKVWFTIKEHGAHRLGAAIEANCRLAQRLAERVGEEGELELLAPAPLNIVCFRYVPRGRGEIDLDALNEEIVVELQERGIAAPSTTRIAGRLAIRVNITNHRTRAHDIELLADSVLAIGAAAAGRLARHGAAEAATPGDRAPAASAFPFAAFANLEAALLRPEIRALAGDRPVSVARTSAAPIAISEAGSLQLEPGALASPEVAAVLVRHGLEIDLWSRLAEGPQGPEWPAATALLAARATGLYLRALPEAERVAIERQLPVWLAEAYAGLAGEMQRADFARLLGETTTALGRLMQLSGSSEAAIRAVAGSTSVRIRAINEFARLSELAEPVEQLLARGGDARIRPLPGTGRNAYGSSLRPAPDELSFSSSTASNVSMPAYVAVEAMRRELAAAGVRGDLATSFAGAMAAVRGDVARLAGAGEAPGSQVVLTASGTDSELIALAFALAGGDGPVTSLVVAPDETGSGVPQAAQGRHFSSETAGGAGVTAGQPIAGLPGSRLAYAAVTIRDAEGRPRTPEAIAGELREAARAAVAAGGRVLLHVLDSAKTGLGAPGLAAIERLRREHGERLDVVVDACQMRLGADSIAAYLRQGCLVQVTGSKFWSGPPFSGALLVPPAFASRLPAVRRLLPALAPYTSPLDWPAAFAEATRDLVPFRNLGLLCRWRAALAEAERYCRVAPPVAMAILRHFAERGRSAIAARELLSLVEAEAPDRSTSAAEDAWGGLATILPFVARRPGADGGLVDLSLEEAKLAHRWLAADLTAALAGLPLDERERSLLDLACHLGQPVRLARPGGGVTGALRLCSSGRLVADVAGRAGPDGDLAARLPWLDADIDDVLDKLTMILRHFERLRGRPG